MVDEERVSVRISSDDLAMLSELVYLKKYSSEAEAVNDAIRIFLDSHFTPEEKEEILERKRARTDLDLSNFTSDGEGAESVLSNVILKGLDNARKGE